MPAQLYYGCNADGCCCYEYGASLCLCECYSCRGAKKAEAKRKEEEKKQ